jgi:hypothetical protein
MCLSRTSRPQGGARGCLFFNIYFKLSSSKSEEQNKLDLPDEGKTLDAMDVVQGTAEDKVVGVGRGTR